VRSGVGDEGVDRAFERTRSAARLRGKKGEERGGGFSRGGASLLEQRRAGALTGGARWQ
jgi:hypothetical protein